MFKSKLTGTPTGKRNPLDVKTHERRDSNGNNGNGSSAHRGVSLSAASGGSSNRANGGNNGNTQSLNAPKPQRGRAKNIEDTINMNE